MSDSQSARYAIIGAGIAGISAAEAIREVDPDGSIVLINGETVPPYCRPLVVEVLEGERTFDEIHLRKPDWFNEKKISVINGDPAQKVKGEEKRLVLESGRTIEWEKLLIATGSRPAPLPIEGFNNIPVFTLYQHDDIDRLKVLCKPGAVALVVGIGLIGLQVITALRELEVKVIAVELTNKVLPMILDVDSAKLAQKRIEDHGIDVRLNTSITKVGANTGGKKTYVANTENGEAIDFDFLVLTTGMRPDLALLEGTGIDTDLGIKVSPEMETNVSGIYAAGDITEYHDWILGRSEIHAHWLNAYRQGRIAGGSMSKSAPKPYEPVYVNSLSVFGLPIQTMGASRLDEPEGSKVYVSESKARPSYTRLVVKDKHLIAATFVNDLERSGVFQYLMREKVDISDVAEYLLDEELEGLRFLENLHKKQIRGEVNWPASMDMIDHFKKDQSRTRWGAGKNPAGPEK